MTTKEIWSQAKTKLGDKCRACPVCDGRACKGEIPGAGAAGNGEAWTVCMDYLKNIKLNMDTMYEFSGTDTSSELFGKSLSLPLMIAPVGVAMNYFSGMTDEEYAYMVVEGAIEAGVLGMLGDGPNPVLFETGLEAAEKNSGMAIPILKPWKNDIALERIEKIKNSGCVALGMDIDTAGFINMRSQAGSVSPKPVADMRELCEKAEIPFIIKGVMTAKGAVKAVEAGAYAIVVSSHGGRVLESCPSTVEVLPEIRAAVGDKIKIFVDGGIRSGEDIFKAIAMGADAVLVGRPYVVAAHGDGKDGIVTYTKKLEAELKNAMLLCGASTIADISADMVRIPK